MFKVVIALHPPLAVGLVSLASCWFNVVFSIIAIVMMFDVVARYKEYKYMCGINDDEKMMSMVRYMKTSWCTRTVAKVVCPRAKSIYKELGYRWYHLFPDKFHRRIITRRFWSSLFGFTKPY